MEIDCDGIGFFFGCVFVYLYFYYVVGRFFVEDIGNDVGIEVVEVVFIVEKVGDVY